MIESRIQRRDQATSTLQEVWPPKWFFSYSDLSVLLMTFFIILATMLSLKIPLYVFADARLKPLLDERMVVFEEIRRLTELEKMMMDEFQSMRPDQVKRLIALEKMNELKKSIDKYIKKMQLENFIKIEAGKWKLRLVPLSPLLFGRGDAVLRQEAKDFLDQIAEFAAMYPSRLSIEGHTDDTPINTRQFSSNWELSAARANSIMRYLATEHKIPSDKIDAVGYGEYRPLVPNDSDTNRASNRRVVIELLI
ncbi:MAG: flagellar motor protein MotB [Candidatus Omnitrophota bacterium]